MRGIGERLDADALRLVGAGRQAVNAILAAHFTGAV
jgi:hypothetical protein